MAGRPTPPAWDAAPEPPRLTLRIVTGTEHGSAAGPHATRFDLYAEAARAATRQRSDAGAAAGLPRKERIGRALLTYANGEMDTRGPTLELLDVKERWQRRGIGRALLSAVERFVLGATSPPPVRVPVELQLCDASLARPFREATGFHWLDEPLCEEGAKNLYASHCTCGRCVGGVMSPAFAQKLESAAEGLREGLQYAIAELHTTVWRSGAAMPLPAEQVDQLLYGEAQAVTCLPRATLRGGVTLPVLTGLVLACDAVCVTAGANELPTPAAVLAQWPQDGASVNARQQLLDSGCGIERVIWFILDYVKHTDSDGMYDDIGFWDEELPECENDHSADARRCARCVLLGPLSRLRRLRQRARRNVMRRRGGSRRCRCLRRG